MSRKTLNTSLMALAVSGMLAFAAPSAADKGKNLILGVDKASLYRLETAASTIIIGNPSIADVNVQDGNLLVFTGKNFGSTNVIILDQNDKEIAEFDVSVRSGGSGSLTVYKGAAKTSFNCAPFCEQSLAVGDDKASFEALKTQMDSKMNISKGSSGTDPAPSPDQ